MEIIITILIVAAVVGGLHIADCALILRTRYNDYVMDCKISGFTEWMTLEEFARAEKALAKWQKKYEEE